MNARVLGTICMIGSAIWALNGVRLIVGGLHDNPDTITSASILVWGIAGLCGILGLVAVKATGTNAILRLISYLPAAGFFCLSAGELLRLTNALPTSENWVTPVGFMLILAGMIVIGILTIAAKTWTGWGKFAPLLVILLVPIGGGLETATGLYGFSTLLPAVGSVLLGYAVQKSEPTRELRTAVA